MVHLGGRSLVPTTRGRTLNSPCPGGGKWFFRNLVWTIFLAGTPNVKFHVNWWEGITLERSQYQSMWVWVKLKPPGDHRFLSLFPFTRVPFWEPQPCDVPSTHPPESVAYGFRIWRNMHIGWIRWPARRSRTSFSFCSTVRVTENLATAQSSKEESTIFLFFRFPYFKPSWDLSGVAAKKVRQAISCANGQTLRMRKEPIFVGTHLTGHSMSTGCLGATRTRGSTCLALICTRLARHCFYPAARGCGDDVCRRGALRRGESLSRRGPYQGAASQRTPTKMGYHSRTRGI